MSSLMSKMMKTSTIKLTAPLMESSVYGKKDIIQTDVPMVNVALSGSLDGGLVPGLTLICGPSKHFKSGYLLLMMAAFLKKHPDGIALFYDSEFGTPIPYFDMFGIDKDRVLHVPLTNIEELKFDIVKQLDNIEKKDNVFIGIDSIGNLASKKEVDDAMEAKSVADMTRAKQIKSLFRIVTPHLNLKDIPMVVVNHIYMETGLYPKAIVSGGSGIYLSSDTIWIVGRQQEKEGTEVTGYKFIINVEKSRHVKEKSKVPIAISFDGGLKKYSGLFDLAQESGHIIKPKMGWFQTVNMETGEVSEKSYRAKDLEHNPEYMEALLQDPTFKDYIKKRFILTGVSSSSQVDYNEIEDEEEF